MEVERVAETDRVPFRRRRSGSVSCCHTKRPHTPGCERKFGCGATDQHQHARTRCGERDAPNIRVKAGRMATRYLRSPSVVVKTHKQEVLAVYRQILRLGAQFPDDVAASYIIWRARNVFHRHASVKTYDRALHLLKEAHQSFRQLQTAYRGDNEAYGKVVELAYGARGRLKHVMKVQGRRLAMFP